MPPNPPSNAHGFAMRSMSLRDMQIPKSEKKILGPPPPKSWERPWCILYVGANPVRRIVNIPYTTHMGIGHILNQKRIGTQLIKRCTRTMTLQLLLKSYSSFFVQKPGLRYKPQSNNTCNPVLLVGKHIVRYNWNQLYNVICCF